MSATAPGDRDRDPTAPPPAEPLAPDDLLFPQEEFIPPGATVSLHRSAAADTPAPVAPLPLANEHYHLEREIARGAMGSVYKGRCAKFGREVAVKLLLDGHLGKAELRRRFAEEVRITAHLQHPAVVPVYEAGEFPGGRPFFAMRFVHGHTLADLLDADPAAGADQPRFLKVFEKVCEGLAYAHAAGVIHRDLKPANVMVGQFGRVKVMDWGVGKVLPHSRLYRGSDDAGPPDPPGGEPGAATQFGRVLGTPAFMSPEQARGDVDRMDERTDVFGLGGLLCLILTGRPPYTGADARTVYRRAKDADLGDAHARLDACKDHPELVALGKRCLAEDPAARPRDAGAMYDELTDYLDYDLRRAERDLVRFFDLSPDLFCIASGDGYFRRVNSNFSRVLGHPTADLLASPFIDFVHPDDRPRTLAVLADLNRGVQCVRFRNRYRDARGEYQWLEWAAKPDPADGMIFAVARDVTEQVRLENQVRFFEDG